MDDISARILIAHWTNQLHVQGVDLEADIIVTMVNLEDIIRDVPPSYLQQPNLVQVQINYLVSLMLGEWKIHAEWLRDNGHFENFLNYSHQLRGLFEQIIDEDMAMGFLEDNPVEENPVEEDPAEEDPEEEDSDPEEEDLDLEENDPQAEEEEEFEEDEDDVEILPVVDGPPPELDSEDDDSWIWRSDPLKKNP